MVVDTSPFVLQSGVPTAVNASVRILHLLTAAVWVGAVAFVTVGVLPLARDGTLNADPLDRIVGRLTAISRASAVVLLFTGGHMAAMDYSFVTLTSTINGYLVLTMVALWLALTALVEVGSSRMRDAFKEKKVRAPARNHGIFYRLAAVVGLLLLVNAGVITTGLLAGL